MMTNNGLYPGALAVIVGGRTTPQNVGACVELIAQVPVGTPYRIDGCPGHWNLSEPGWHVRGISGPLVFMNSQHGLVSRTERVCFARNLMPLSGDPDAEERDEPVKIGEEERA